ncbi:sugar phosphate isomerase/epimerase family protein [Glaciibacter superstes]|uniref:sugar phosphate isomerase/epimerase family protein n=1 Tax=Glaciibacter superstes TaxID=501023 RepID=UPI000686A15A|nr:sugar phosphate isomerase/epimerase [Glaciibacter superstes]
MEADPAGTLRRIADIGLTQVEPYKFTAFGPALGEALSAAGLSAPTTHQGFIGTDAAAVFGAAGELGIGTVIDPFVGPERWVSRESVAAIATELNAAARVAADYGVQVGYHNHAHELQSVIDGTPALEIFADLLDPAVVLEIDTYWVVVGGLDPVELIGRLGDRVRALHIKDGPGTQETKDQVAVGSGSLPIRAIIESAPNALRVIELDDSRADRFEAVADSFRYLTAEGLA